MVLVVDCLRGWLLWLCWGHLYSCVCDCVPARDWGLKCVGVGECAYSSCMVCLLSVTGAPNYMVINPCF